MSDEFLQTIKLSKCTEVFILDVTECRLGIEFVVNSLCTEVYFSSVIQSIGSLMQSLYMHSGWSAGWSVC